MTDTVVSFASKGNARVYNDVCLIKRRSVRGWTVFCGKG